MIRLAALVCLVFCLALPGHAWTGQSCTSAHRIAITLTAGPAGHSGEIEINLVSADFPASYVFGPAGNDVRVLAANDTTPIDFVVASWNAAARTARLYIRPGSLAANSSTVVRVYVGDSALAAASNAAAVFPSPGLRLESRLVTANPQSPSAAYTAFRNATGASAVRVSASLDRIRNRDLGLGDRNFAWCVSAILEVTTAKAGSWAFRTGTDSGHGGHLEVAGVMLEDQWTEDLGWNQSWTNTAETLEGNIALAQGWHRFELLAFENGFGALSGWQAREPGGNWIDFSSTNFPVRAARCAVISTVSIVKSAPQSCTTTLNVSQTVSVVSDPGGNANPYALPGSRVRYEFVLSNPGQRTDASTLVLADQLPSSVAIVISGASAFEFIDDPFSSGLSFTWGGMANPADSVEFSSDGVNFDYVPTASASGTDAAVTHVRFRPTGNFAPFAAGQSPGFRLRFSAVVK